MITRLKLIRLTSDKNKIQKLGILLGFDRYKKLFECYTLEPFNSIPANYYTVKKYMSPKMQRQVLLYDFVSGHQFMEIHNGNFRKDTVLCQLTGKDIVDINSDGLKDVTESKPTLDKLLALIPDKISVQIDVFENPKDVFH